MFPIQGLWPTAASSRGTEPANPLPIRLQAVRPHASAVLVRLNLTGLETGHSKSNAQLRLTIHLGQVVLKNRLGHVDRREDVGHKTDNQGDREAPNGAGSKKA